MKNIYAGLLLLLNIHPALPQDRREDIYAASTLYQQRVLLEKDLRERIIGHTFSLPLDSNSEDKYLSACWAISQFLFATPEVEQGFDKLFAGYDSLGYDTKEAALEAVYAVYPRRYLSSVGAILEKETNPKLFSICAAYLYRCDTSTDNSNAIKIRMAEKFPGYDTLPILRELQDYLSYHAVYTQHRTPDLTRLFAWQRTVGQKIIYSFQRWDRDYPGLAIVQNADGSLVRDGQGKLQVFEQLARSGPDLPYFITNGSTPQGIYSIQGMEVSRTSFIGPTPNLQLIMPFESRWEWYFREPAVPARQPAPPSTTGSAGDLASPIDSLRQYLDLLPPSWREYAPMKEAWSAGRIGRTEIIAHGTTIDPEYFKDRPFYPLTPTMGCLCAKELWNPTSGHLLTSEQFNLVSAFRSTPGDKGYLYVINVDDQHKPVSRAEVEAWVKKWEEGRQ